MRHLRHRQKRAQRALREAQPGRGRFVPLDDFCRILLPLSPFSLHKSPESPARTWHSIKRIREGECRAFSRRVYLGYEREDAVGKQQLALTLRTKKSNHITSTIHWCQYVHDINQLLSDLAIIYEEMVHFGGIL